MFNVYDHSYEGIVEEVGVLLQSVTLGCYQGDILCLARQGEQYGYVQMGYGSCSYCDALQGCETEADYRDLAQSIQDSIVWRTKADMLAWFQEHDWAGDYFTCDPDLQPFIELCIKTLSE